MIRTLHRGAGPTALDQRQNYRAWPRRQQAPAVDHRRPSGLSRLGQISQEKALQIMMWGATGGYTEAQIQQAAQIIYPARTESGLLVSGERIASGEFEVTQEATAEERAVAERVVPLPPIYMPAPSPPPPTVQAPLYTYFAPLAPAPAPAPTTSIAPPPPGVPMIYERPPAEIGLDLAAPESGEPAAPSPTATIIEDDGTGRRAVGVPGVKPASPFRLPGLDRLLEPLKDLEKKLPDWAQGWPWYYWAALIVAAYYATRITTRKRRRKRR